MDKGANFIMKPINESFNDTIQHQLNHKSIRAFKDISLDHDTIQTLVDVARHTASSQFLLIQIRKKPSPNFAANPTSPIMAIYSSSS